MGDDVKVRDETTGRFVKGHSGNAAGRPVGVRNQTSIVKDFINNALVNDLQEDALEILAVAIKKAKAGDNAMIKMLLTDLISQAAGDETDTSDVVIKVKNMTLSTEKETIIIPHEDNNE